MTFSLRSAAFTLLTVVASIQILACGGDDDTTPTPGGTETVAVSASTAAATPVVNAFAGVPGIVDPANHGWPREVEGLNGKVKIAAKPVRIHTMSSGFDEITAGIVPLKNIAAVGKATQDPNTSNIADLVKALPAVAREPEQIASVNPDLVVASATQKADLIANIERLGIKVIQLDIDPTPKGRINTILLLGYLYGEEERAIALAKEVSGRYDAVVKITTVKPEAGRPVVLNMVKFTAYNASGKGTTGEGIVVAAGGVNAATKGGIDGNKQVSLESIVAMAPDIIILPMPQDSGKAIQAELLASAALKEVPAIKNNRVLIVPPELYVTNSYANVRAVEHLASILWPSDFPGATYAQFSLPVNK